MKIIEIDKSKHYAKLRIVQHKSELKGTIKKRKFNEKEKRAIRKGPITFSLGEKNSFYNLNKNIDNLDDVQLKQLKRYNERLDANILLLDLDNLTATKKKKLKNLLQTFYDDGEILLTPEDIMYKRKGLQYKLVPGNEMQIKGGLRFNKTGLNVENVDIDFDNNDENFYNLLTRDELKALSRYQANSYRINNEYVRNGRYQYFKEYPDELQDSTDIEYMDMVDDMLSSMKKSGGLHNNYILYRGGRLPRNFDELKVGDVLETTGFTSTSTEWQTATGFRSNNGCIYRIYAPSGTEGIHISDVYLGSYSEHEFVLKFGQKYKIMDIQESERHNYVIDVMLI
jgi:hypothetical protein